MLSFEDAREKVLQAMKPVGTEFAPLQQSADRIVAEPIVAPVHLPPFDNSAMDGYAVRATDVANASSTAPIALRVIGKVAAGATFDGAVQEGTCVRVFTGSVLPRGADAVVMQEDTKVAEENTIEVFDKVTPWENVRFRGEDVKQGSVVVETGERLSATRVSLLGALGFDAIPVARKPVVGLIATGTELREPGLPLTGAAIYESNRAGLAALMMRAGAAPKIYPLVPDDFEATVSALQTAFSECDVVVSSGGVSVGEFDYVKMAFEKLGGKLNFWKVALRPGKPFVFGSWNGKYLFGLPGNPVSSLVTCSLFVWPALLKIQKAKFCMPPMVMAKTAETLVNHGDRRLFMRVIIDEKGEAHSAGPQAAHVLSAAARASGLVDVPPKGAIEKGSLVSVLRWD